NGFNPFQSFNPPPSSYGASNGFNPFQSFNPPPSSYGASSGGGMFGYQPRAMGSGTSQPTGGMAAMQEAPNFGAPSMGGSQPYNTGIAGGVPGIPTQSGGAGGQWQPSLPSQAMQNYWAGEGSAMTGGGMQLPSQIIDPATGQAHPMPGAQTTPGGSSGTVGSMNSGAGMPSGAMPTSPMQLSPAQLSHAGFGTGIVPIPGGPIHQGPMRPENSINTSHLVMPQPMMRRPSGPFRSRGGGYL
ncbi:MAG: hypothetical protein ACREHG_06220, partial [Candidatus Saccharimonadales bacterium]